MSLHFRSVGFPGAYLFNSLRTDQQPCWWDWVVREWDVNFSYNVVVDYSYTQFLNQESYMHSFGFSAQDSGLVPYEKIYRLNSDGEKMPRYGDVIFDKADYIQTEGWPYPTVSFKKPGDLTEYKSTISKIRLITNEVELPMYGRFKTKCETPVTVSKFDGKNRTSWGYWIPLTCESLYPANQGGVFGGAPSYGFKAWQSYEEPSQEGGINPSYSLPEDLHDYRSVGAGFSFLRPRLHLFSLGGIGYELIWEDSHYVSIEISVNGPTEPGQWEGGWEQLGGGAWSLFIERNLGQIGQMTYKCGSMPDLVLPVTARVSFEISATNSDEAPMHSISAGITFLGTATPTSCFTYGGIYDENTGQRV